MRAARITCACLAGLAVLGHLPSAALRSQTLGFPMTNDICPTSSFGSYRAGHLHAGMDFSTGGVTGVPVVAVDSCYVWRIRLWNGGYGKALYAQLPDGTVAVYGHLSRYRPELEARVEAEQDRLGRYEVELYFGPDEFRFAPGDTLAYSGDTGSGPAHLHFELRSGQGDHDKINPVPDYLDITEHLSPFIEKIAIVPLSPWSSVNGSFETLVRDRDQVSGVFEVAGPFGLSVMATDHAQCGKVITPVVYEAWLEGQPIWRFRMATFPFSKSYIVGALYDLIDGKKYVRLFQPEPLDLSGFGQIVHDQLWSAMSPPAREEPYDLQVRVLDAWGNSDSLGIQVRAVPNRVPRWPVTVPRVLSTGRRKPASDAGIEIETSVHSEYIEVTARILSPGITVTYAELGGWTPGPLLFLALEDRLLRTVIEPGEAPCGDTEAKLEVTFSDGDSLLTETRIMQIGMASKGRGFEYRGERFALELLPPEEDLPRTLIEIKEDSTGVYDRFASFAGRILLEPRGEFLHKGLKFRIRDLNRVVTPKHAVYADRDGWPVYLGRFDPAGVCRITLRNIENLVVLEDSVPPEITSIGSFRRRADGKATFRARIADLGSGTDAGSIKSYVDGDTAIVSIDPDTARLTGRTRKPLKYGRHTIRLEAEDRLGNLAVKEVVLDLSR